MFTLGGKAIDFKGKILARWSDERKLTKGCSAAGTSRKFREQSKEEQEHGAKLLQIVCYFRSTYEVLIDADEHLSELMGPADLLVHLRVLVQLPPLQLVPVLKYLVCWPIARWLRQEMPEVPSGMPQEILSSPLKLFSKRPRSHLKNLVVSRTKNRRAFRVVWSWLQGAKRGLPEIPPEFILASKLKHAKALQKELPPMDELYLADFKQELKILWRGVHSERERFFRDEEGIVRLKGTVRQWKADRPVRQGAGNPGWNACVEKSRGQGGKSEAVREELRSRIQDKLDKYIASDPSSRSGSILPKVPMRVIAKWAADDIRDRPLNARVEVIPEPLKARIITKGESLPYYASMPLQKDAWRTLVEKEEFSLIGEPLSEQHLIAIDQGTLQLLDAVGLPDVTFDLGER